MMKREQPQDEVKGTPDYSGKWVGLGQSVMVLGPSGVLNLEQALSEVGFPLDPPSIVTYMEEEAVEVTSVSAGLWKRIQS